jgi:hypothetical protein
MHFAGVRQSWAIAGLIRHKDLLHKGEHEPIIEAPMFDAVQKQLKTNGRGRGNQLINKHGAILEGILRCSACDHAMVHTFTRKKEKIDRYYSCTQAIKSGRDACPTPNRTMAAFCSAVNFLRVLVIGILQETGYVSLIRGNSTF